MITTFTENEQQFAREIAQRRLEGGREKGTDRLGWDSLDSHLFGVLGEWTVAKALGLDYRLCYTVNEFRNGKPDLTYKGFSLEVRFLSQPYAKVKPSDKDNAIVIGVTATRDGFRIMGIIQASQGKSIGEILYPGDMEPAFFVKEELLSPLSKLIEWENK